MEGSTVALGTGAGLWLQSVMTGKSAKTIAGDEAPAVHVLRLPVQRREPESGVVSQLTHMWVRFVSDAYLCRLEGRNWAPENKARHFATILSAILILSDCDKIVFLKVFVSILI